MKVWAISLLLTLTAYAATDHLALEKKFFQECNVRYQTAYVSELKDELVPLIDQATKSCLQSKYNAFFLSQLGQVGIPRLPETQYHFSTSLSGLNSSQSYDQAMSFLAHALTAYQGQQQLDRINEETMQEGLEVLKYRLNQSMDTFKSQRETMNKNIASVQKHWSEELVSQLQQTRENAQQVSNRVQTLRQQIASMPATNPLKQSAGLMTLNSAQDLHRMQEAWPQHQISPYSIPISAQAKKRHKDKYQSGQQYTFPAATYQQGKVDLLENTQLKSELSQSLSSAQKFHKQSLHSPEAYKIAHDLVNAVAAKRYQALGLKQAPEQQQLALISRVQHFEEQGSIFKTKKQIVQNNLASGTFDDHQDWVAREGLAIAEGFNATAEEQFYKAELAYGEELRDTAIQLLDVAMGFTPVVSTVKDAYELFAGKNILTGIELSSTERALAGVGVATLGFAGITKLPKFMGVLESMGKKMARPISRAVLDSSQRIIESAAKLGVTSGQQIKGLLEKPVGKVWAKIQSLGKVEAEGSYKVFNKEIPINNPLPQDGMFARVVPKHLADKIKSGELPLSRPNGGNEAFVTALEDIKDVTNPKDFAARLSLYSDEAATTIANTSDAVALKFRFKGDVAASLRSPIELLEKRGFGFVPSGRTQGNVREWLIDNDAYQKGLIEFIE
jgi:hypothetical protein